MGSNPPASLFGLQTLRQKLARISRRRWMQRNLRDISDNDNHVGLERIYQKPDPWNLDSPLERARFEATNRIIESRFGHVQDLLEIGSSEGVQSSYLRRMCRNLYGIEVSPTAVERARTRVPDAQFFVGDLPSQRWLETGKRFDLIVACEVLYYIRDPRATIEMMNQLADACLVTFFTPEAYKLAAIVDAIPGVEKGWFTYDRVTWLMAWWRNRPAQIEV